MSSSSTCRLIVLVSAACYVMTSAELTVNLGTADSYAILAKSGISTVPTSTIIGDIGVSPIAATAITGFGLALDASGQFSTASQIHESFGYHGAEGEGVVSGQGQAHAADYGAPVSVALTTAVLDMQAAYTNAANRVNNEDHRINLNGGILGGDHGGPDHQLIPGVYTFNSDVRLNSEIHFKGFDTPEVYIIQITGNLILAANTDVVLDRHIAKPENIFWQVAGYVEIGVGAKMQGIILGKTKVDVLTGASHHGRIFAQTAVNLQMATITEPGHINIEGVEAVPGEGTRSTTD